MAKDPTRKKQLQKLGQVKLTEEEKVLIAANINSPFFKLIAEKILPSRVNQLSLTCVSVAQDDKDLWNYKGRVAEADWLPKYLEKQIANVDDTDFSNDSDESGEIAAEDDDNDL
jgi:hypothetical protein